MRSFAYLSCLCGALAVAVAFMGCGGAPVTPGADMAFIGTLPLALGGVADNGDSSSAFVPFTEGQDDTLVPGAQGGFHVWMKLRVGGGPRTLIMTKTAHRVSDGKIVLRANGYVQVGAAGHDGMWELPMATPMFMCPSPIGIKINDEAILYEIALSDDANVTLAHAEVTLVPRCPATPENMHTLCLMICVG